MPVEQLLVGDRILTRNEATEELTFRLLIGLDTKPKREVRTMEVGSRTIVSTPDQPFYVPDGGWRKASELEPGMQLGALEKPLPISSVRSGDAPLMYALVIADVHNFFVDRQGILVQDASKR